MLQTKNVFTLLFVLCLAQSGFSQSWVDTLDNYGRSKFLPPAKYLWLWTDAALLNTMTKEYELAGLEKKQVYLDYVKKAMQQSAIVANGRTPNDVASGLGLAFLYRITKDEKYKTKADKIYNDYLKIQFLRHQIDSFTIQLATTASTTKTSLSQHPK